MRQETSTLSQKELQRVTVISQCVQGNLTCARAAELLDLSPRHVKRLKSSYRQGSAAALAHVSRGRPSPGARRKPYASASWNWRARATMAGSRSTIAIPGSIIPTLREGDIFTLLQQFGNGCRVRESSRFCATTRRQALRQGLFGWRSMRDRKRRGVRPRWRWHRK